MKKSYYGLKSFLRHKGRKHFCKGETLTSMLNRMAFQQVPYEKLSQRTFSFLIRLPPSIYLRHSYDEEDNSNQLHNVHTSSTFEQWHPTIHLKPKIWNRTNNVILRNINFQTCNFTEGEYFYNWIVFWPGIILSLITTPVITSNIFIKCWCFWDVDICIWFFRVTVVNAHILLLFTTVGRFINDIIMLFISTSITVYDFVQLGMGSLSSISCPTILDSSSCAHGFFSTVWNACSCSDILLVLKCLLLFW